MGSMTNLVVTHSSWSSIEKRYFQRLQHNAINWIDATAFQEFCKIEAKTFDCLYFDHELIKDSTFQKSLTKFDTGELCAVVSKRHIIPLTSGDSINDFQQKALAAREYTVVKSLNVMKLFLARMSKKIVITHCFNCCFNHFGPGNV